MADVVVPVPVPLWQRIAQQIYARVFQAWKTTLLAIAIQAAEVALNELQAEPSPTVRWVAGVLSLLLVAYKGKRPAPAPVVLPLLLLLALPARAQEMPPQPTPPAFGGCTKSGKLCFGPAASVSLVALDLRKQTVSAGISPGVGYGLTVHRGEWDAYGVDVYLAASVATQRASVTVMLKAAQYLRLGLMWDLIGSERGWRIPVGVGLDF